VRRGAGASKSRFRFFCRNSSNRRSQRFLSQTSASFVSHWEAGQNNVNKTNGGDLEMVEVNSCVDKSKNPKKKSSPERKCLLFYKPGKKVVLWKDPMSVCENGGNKSKSAQ
jgi:hypothetical protein